LIELPQSFTHQPPKGYSYGVESFKRNLLRIWINNHSQFSYTSEQVKSIWGFYDTKKCAYFAPINSQKVGALVEFDCTTPYSAMQLNRKGLELLWM